MRSERVRLADLLAAVSVATDLGMGQEPEKAMCACLVATALARRMGTPEADVSDVYYMALLRHLGCKATAHEEAWLGGDELVSRPAAERADFGSPRESFGLLLQMGRGDRRRPGPVHNPHPAPGEEGGRVPWSGGNEGVVMLSELRGSDHACHRNGRASVAVVR